MPLYDYECEQCHRHTEKIQKFSDAPLTECPHCGGHLERVLHAPAVAFKGGGWYADGYGNKKAGGTSGEGRSGESKTSASKGETKSSESKSDAGAKVAETSTSTPAASTPATSSAATAPATAASSSEKK